jgi:hypothetical protein
MQEIIQLIRRKNQLLYDMNCVRRYIEAGDYDTNLKNAWDSMNTELEEVDNELQSLRKPQMDEFERRKMELLEKIRLNESEVCSMKLELKEIDKMMLKLN